MGSSSGNKFKSKNDPEEGLKFAKQFSNARNFKKNNIR